MRHVAIQCTKEAHIISFFKKILLCILIPTKPVQFIRHVIKNGLHHYEFKPLYFIILKIWEHKKRVCTVMQNFIAIAKFNTQFKQHLFYSRIHHCINFTHFIRENYALNV